MKRAIRFTTLFVCASLMLILLAPTTLALTRRTHLSNFINSAKTPKGGYQSTSLPSNASAGFADLMSTCYAINMSLYLGRHVSDFIDPASWILDNLKTVSNGFRMDEIDTTATMAAIYLAASALNATEKTSSLGQPFRDWIEARQNVSSGGFDSQEVSGITTTLATYYAIEAFYYLGNGSLAVNHEGTLRPYFSNCNNPDGGFADIVGKESTLESTWAAVAGLSRLNALMKLPLTTGINVENTLTYVSQFYFSNPTDTFNCGGYGTSDRATVRDTFFAQEVYSLLNTENPNETNVTKYLLGCQNIADGGFAEKNVNNDYRTSSMLTSYYAYEALKTIDPQLGMLNVEVWFLPFDYILLIIILGVVIVVIAGGIHYYRKHHD